MDKALKYTECPFEFEKIADLCYRLFSTYKLSAEDAVVACKNIPNAKLFEPRNANQANQVDGVFNEEYLIGFNDRDVENRYS